MELYTVFENEVCRAKCVPVGGIGFDGESFRVEIYTTGNSVERKVNTNVGIAGSLVASAIQVASDGSKAGLRTDERYVLAIRAARKFKARNKMIVVDDYNYKDLFKFGADNNEAEEEVKNVILKLNKLKPGIKFSEREIFASTFLPRKEILKCLTHFAEAGFLERGVGITHQEAGLPSLSTYKLTPDGYKESFVRNMTQRATAAEVNMYFNIVDIPKIRGKKFGFVIMPFREKEISQVIYKELIKPIFEEKSGFMCIRSDDIRSPGSIDDRIYTCI